MGRRPIRTLIIDNYDSFTYNLVHQVTQVTGAVPEVVRNDEPGWTLAELDRFDALVISPGPGRPDRASDFGVCGDVIRSGRLPLLGVCLGHQGICSVLGGDVQPAPEPVHGRTSPVLHGQVDILAGLPSPFAAVRYHSLVVTRLPDDLEAIGWTGDGLVMAVRHRTLPMWGVQFHPESICTEHGDRLLRNFLDLARPWRRQHATPLRGHRGASVGAGRADRLVRRRRTCVRLHRRSLVLDLTAEQIFDALFRPSDHAFWLDSSLTSAAEGRFSFLGDTTGPLARVATADVWAGRVTVRSSSGEEVIEASFFDWLEADLAANRIDAAGAPFSFTLGWVGYLGYELKAECGGARTHRSPHPDAVLIFADRGVVIDHVHGTIHLLALSREDPVAAGRWLTETATRLRSLAQTPELPAPDPLPSSAVGDLALRHDRQRYLALIATCRQQIAEGESYEICLTNQVSGPGDVSPWQAYRLLRRANPAPYGAYLRLGRLCVLSSSPERFLRIDAVGNVETKPIKGTRRRGTSTADDESLRSELATSSKDRSENLMIVDLVRHDLGRCAQPGSVRVHRLFEVETFATVHQLVSTVRARLRSGVSAVDCVRAAFPAGSMTGAPKVRTMQLIDDLERAARGIYSGALGYFSLSGDVELSVTIRTIVLSGKTLEYGAGGAIVALSDPAAEWDEVAAKMTPLLRLLGRGSLRDALGTE